jgi:uncharacterized protein (UPF0335 family)
MSEVIAIEQLKQCVTKIEKLEQEKAELAEDIKDVFLEAKANGFDTRGIKEVLKLRKLDKAKLAEQDSILELYRQALDL